MIAGRPARRMFAAKIRALFNGTYRRPPEVHEDGSVSVAVLLPGEFFRIERTAEGRPFRATVERPDGTVRVRAEWRDPDATL